MSETKMFKGTMKEVALPDGQSVEQFAEKALRDKGVDDPWDGDWLSTLTLDYQDKFAFVGDKLYEMMDYKDISDEDICDASRNSDGSISFVVRYYNGGCGFDEVLEDAVEELSKEETNRQQGGVKYH